MTTVTSSLLILDARRFLVIVKTLDFDSLIGTLLKWNICKKRNDTSLELSGIC